MLARRQAAHPDNKQLLVLHQEKYQDWHQNQVDQYCDQSHDRGQRNRQQPLSPGCQLDTDQHHDLVDLLGRGNLGILLGQFKQHFLADVQHARDLLHKLGGLCRQQRQ